MRITKDVIKEYITITAATLLVAVGIYFFKFPNHFSTGGVSGISVILIHDGDTESLIRKYLKAGVMNKGIYEATDVGTPQGGNLSPLLSNIMLNELDKELESRGQRFTLYADDVVIVLKSKAAATRVRPPSKNRHKKASKNEMNRSISLIY